MGSKTTANPAPASITRGEFQDALGRYDQIIEEVSASKNGPLCHTASAFAARKLTSPPVKPGQKTLAELDRYRYTEAPALFSSGTPGRNMQIEDVKALVEWKLYATVCWYMAPGGHVEC